jgi:regulator of protease activity HflC (stomatin/prohibitin superfamily)
VAGRSFDDLLTVNREQFQQDVLTRLDERCRNYGPGGLGVRLDGLALRDLHPPQEVVAAYHDVTRAMEIRDRDINEAEATALRAERDARAKAVQVVRLAESNKNKRVRDAEAERAVFLARLRTRTHLDVTQEWSLLQPTLDALADGQLAEVAWADFDRRRREALAARAALTDFRLYWDRLGQALSGREKLLIDAEKVNGKRNLLLFDPDAFRMPLPVMSAPERAPPRGRS